MFLIQYDIDGDIGHTPLEQQVIQNVHLNMYKPRHCYYFIYFSVRLISFVYLLWCLMFPNQYD